MAEPLLVVPYDPHWPVEFETERNRIARALGAVARRIDHHGSTAVPGLDAKPIIDMQISVDRLKPMQHYADPLASLGYMHMPHPDDQRCPFFHRPARWPHSHHVHVVETGGLEERRTLAFRDFLREHGDVARDYAALKRQLAGRYAADNPADREAYALAKSEFVERIVRIALQRGYPRE